MNVSLYDTTLRDGTQGDGVNFSSRDKLRIADELDDFGIHYIEGGWPGSNPKDVEFFELAKKEKFKHAKIAAFGSTRRKDVKVGGRSAGADAARRGDAGRHHLRQDVAAARHRGPPHHAGGEPRDDPRHRALLQAGRARGALRRGAFLRRLQGRAGLRAGHPGGRARRRRGHARALRDERRLPAA